MDEERITEEETIEEAADGIVEEPAAPEPEPMPDYAGMIGEVREELGDLRRQIEELRSSFAVMVENGATIRDDSLPEPTPIVTDDGFTYTPLQELDYSL